MFEAVHDDDCLLARVLAVHMPRAKVLKHVSLVHTKLGSATGVAPHTQAAA